MNDDADLRGQSEGKGERHRPEVPGAQEVPGLRDASAFRLSRGARCGSIAVRAQPQHLGTADEQPQHEGCEHAHHHDHQGKHGGRESEPSDEKYERRHQQDPADGRPVERNADGQAPFTLEPGSDDDVEGGPTHGRPPHGHQRKHDVELPRLPDPGQPDGRGPHRRHADQHHPARAEALEHVSDERDQRGPHEVEDGDRRRDGARGPAVALDQLGQKDPDPVKSKPPPEHGNQKRTADHLPSLVHAFSGAHGRRGLALGSSLASASGAPPIGRAANHAATAPPATATPAATKASS